MHSRAGFVRVLCLAVFVLIAGCSSSGKKSPASRSSAKEEAEGGVYDRRIQVHLIELRSRDPRIRADAAAGIGSLRPGPYLAKAVPDLIATLADREPKVRNAAAASLGSIADKRALGPLQAAFGDPNNDDEVRTTLAAALGRIPDPASVPLLAPRLGDPNASPKFRLAAIETIAAIDAPARAEVLLAVINDKDDEVRQAAVLALGKAKAVQAVDRLIELLADKDPRVVETAVWSLAEIADKRAFEPMVKLLDSPTPRARWAAASGLGKLGDGRGGPPLAKLIRRDEAKFAATATSRDAEDPAVIAAAAFSLAKIGDPASLDAVGVALRHPDPIVRQTAAQALGTVKHQRAVALLVESVGRSDSSYTVRQIAAASLGEIGKELALGPVLKMLNSDDVDQRRAGAFVLGLALKSVDAVEPLIRLLADKDSQVRESAVRALGAIGDGRAVAPLLPALDSTDSRTVELAAEALGKLKDPRAVGPLCRLVTKMDARDHCRPIAVQALGLIGDRAATAMLVELLRGKDEHRTKELAARALAKIGDPNAVPALLELLTATKPTFERRPMRAGGYVNSNDVLAAAMDALGTIGDARAIPALREMKERGHPDLVSLADAALAKISPAGQRK
jgi:HEAT repeat protein